MIVWRAASLRAALSYRMQRPAARRPDVRTNHPNTKTNKTEHRI